jgi:hypothetical protein
VKTSIRVATATLLALGWVSALPTASSQNLKPTTAKATSTQGIELPEGGRLAGGVYTNSQYKLELRIPQGFALEQPTAEDEKLGAELLAGGNQERQRALEAASKGNISLIEVTQQAPGVYRSVSVLAEDLSAAPLVESGRDYINHVTLQLRASKMKMKALDKGDENLDGRIFSTQALEMQVKGATIHQAYSAAVIGRRALVLILTSESPNGLRELMTQFKPRFSAPMAPPTLQQANLRQGVAGTNPAHANNGLYTNSFFKMNFRVPSGWTLRDGAREAVRQKAMASASNPKAQQALQPGGGMEVLFIATPPESTNSVMMMSVALGVRGAKIPPDVLLDSITTTVHKKGFQAVSKPENKKISGQKFVRAIVKGSTAGLDVYQAYNAAVLRDHLVCLVVTARNEDELDNLLKVSAKNLEFE